MPDLLSPEAAAATEPATRSPEAAAATEPAIRSLDAAEAMARLPELADLLVDAVAHGASVNFMAGFQHHEAEGFWRAQVPGIADGGRVLLVAEEHARIVGTVVLTFAPQPNAPHRAEIGKMLVHSSLRRRGLGARLLTAAEERAKAAGRTLLLLDTETGSAGEALYRRCGWTEWGVVPGHSYRTNGELASATYFLKQV